MARASSRWTRGYCRACVTAPSHGKSRLFYWRAGGGLVGQGAGAACCPDGAAVDAGGAAVVVLGFCFGLVAGLTAVVFFLTARFLTGFIGLGGGDAGVKSTCTGFGCISGKPLLFETG